LRAAKFGCVAGARERFLIEHTRTYQAAYEGSIPFARFNLFVVGNYFFTREVSSPAHHVTG
jgi:hypothetical protein